MLWLLSAVVRVVGDLFSFVVHDLICLKFY